MPATASRTFTYSPTLRLLTALGLVALLALVGAALAWDERVSTRDAILIWSGLALVASWLYLELHAARVTLDTNGVVIYGWLGRWRRFRWTDIQDLDCSPRVISIAVRGRKGRMQLLKGARGYSLESFDELQGAIAERAMPHLLEVWNRIALPVIYRYPGLTRGAIVGYLASLLFVISYAALLIPHPLFVMASLGLLSPFFFRDWRRAHGALRLTPDDVERINGKRVLISWKSVTELIILDPTVGGYGWILLLSDDGRQIRIPRSSRECGAIRHLLSQTVGVGEDYDQEPAGPPPFAP